VGPTYQFRHASLQDTLVRGPDMVAPVWEQVSRD